jgi:hypothetical protein
VKNTNEGQGLDDSFVEVHKTPSQVDWYGQIQKDFPKIGLTSGFRTKEYQADMKRRGYKPDANSKHLTGDSIDINSFPGMNLAQGAAQLRKRYPQANILYGDKNHKDHVHLTFPGYGGFPALGGAKDFGVQEPTPDWVEPSAQAGPSLEEAQMQGMVEGAKTPNQASMAPQLLDDRDEPGSTIGTRVSVGRSDVLQTLDNMMTDRSKSVSDIIDYFAQQGVKPSAEEISGWKYYKDRPNMTPPGAKFRDGSGEGYTISENEDAGTALRAARLGSNNLSQGAANMVGLPVDIVTAGANLIPGVDIKNPVGGSQSIKDALDYIGVVDQTQVPQGAAEEFSAAFNRIAGENIIPAGGLVKRGTDLVGKTVKYTDSATKRALDQLAKDSADKPWVTAISELSATIGEAAAEELTEDSDNAFVRALGPIVGAIIGGATGGVPAYKISKQAEEQAAKKAAQEARYNAPQQPTRMGPDGVEGQAPQLKDDNIDPATPLTVNPAGDVPWNSKRGQQPKAGNINLNRITGSQAAKEAIRATADQAKGFPNATKTQKREATAALANDLGMTVKELTSKRPSDFTPEEAVYLRRTLTETAEVVVDLAKQARVNNSDEALELFTRAWLSHAALQEQVAGVTAYAGRLLDSFNIKVGSAGADKAKLLKQLTGPLAERGNMEALVKKVLEVGDNPSAVNRLTRDAAKPGFEDKLFSWWYNMVLSGPWTHAVNLVSTGANVLTDVAENVGAAVGGTAIRAANKAVGRQTKDAVTWGEIGQRFSGLASGAVSGTKNLAKAYKLGTPLDRVIRTDSYVPQAGTKVGMVLQSPTRALAAEDEFFRSVAAKSELNGLAHRAAYSEGKRGAALKARREEIKRGAPKLVESESVAIDSADSLGLRGTTKLEHIQKLVKSRMKAEGFGERDIDKLSEIVNTAEETGKLLRFQEETEGLVRKLEDARISSRGDRLATRIAKAAYRINVPFVKTINGLLKTAGRRTPLGIFSTRLQKEIAAGGARRDKALSQIAMGTAVSAYIMSEALDGRITGAGPSDYRQVQELKSTGWQEYSLLINGEWVSYRRLDPFATVMGTIATTAERWDELEDETWDKKIASSTLAMTQELGSKTFLSSALDNIAATQETRPEQAFSFIGNMAASFVVPSFVNQLNQSFGDDTMRSTTGDGGFTDRIKGSILSRVPGVSGGMTAKYDVFGRELKRHSPADPVVPDEDMVVSEVASLHEELGANVIGYPGKTFKIDGEEFKLSTDNDAYQEYVKLAGQYVYTEIQNEMLGNPDWGYLDAEGKKKVIDKIKTASRKQAREELFGFGDVENMDDAVTVDE